MLIESPLGALVYDPCIGNYLYTQEEVVTYPFLEKNNGILGLNASFMANLSAAHSSCGYQNIIDTYYRFPPPGNQPPMVWNASAHPECDVFDNAYGALLEINPCFDIYEINQQCPLLWDVLSFPTGLMYTPEGATTYFNQTNVKEAIHAPVYVDWMICRWKYLDIPYLRLISRMIVRRRAPGLRWKGAR